MAWIDRALQQGMVGLLVAAERGVEARSSEDRDALSAARSFALEHDVLTPLADLRDEAAGRRQQQQRRPRPSRDARVVEVFSRAADADPSRLMAMAMRHRARRQRHPRSSGSISSSSMLDNFVLTGGSDREDSVSWHSIDISSGSDSESSVRSGWSANP